MYMYMFGMKSSSLFLVVSQIKSMLVREFYMHDAQKSWEKDIVRGREAMYTPRKNLVVGTHF